MTLSVEERDRIESALHVHQTKLSMAVAIAHLGIWELNLATGEIVMSDEVKTQFGLSAGELLTKDGLFALIHPDDRLSVKEAFDDAVEKGTDYTAEFRIVSSTGDVRWFSSIGRCVPAITPTMLGVCVDITTRKKNAEVLEKIVAQRTAALHDTIAELEAFSYSISHDMRAPLRAMRCFSEIVLKECEKSLSDEMVDYLRRIAAAGERMDQLIQDVLTLSRISRSELRLEPVDLDCLVRGILECYPNLQRPNAEIRVEGNLQWVTGNPAALTQCVSNLLGNAVKFVARDKMPRVRIWAEAVSRGDEQDVSIEQPSTDFLRLSIEDNGIGIPEHQHTLIFGIFQQLNRGYDGTGIGLSIVKKGVERMGGRVGLKSAPGHGSTFWLDLPVASVGLEAIEAPPSEKRSEPMVNVLS